MHDIMQKKYLLKREIFINESITCHANDISGLRDSSSN